MHLILKLEPGRHLRLAGVSLILAVLAACAEPAKPLEECEEGVASLSGATTLVPANC